MTNQAAWIKEKQGKPLVIDEADMYKPGAGEVLIRNHAVSINPVDWVMQDHAFFPMSYPNILGCDIAGEIVEVGPEVTDFKKGDRVISHAINLVTGSPSHGAFQQYVIGQGNVTAIIPDNLAYEQAVVLPLAISTAACGLYQSHHLALPLPSIGAARLGKTLLVWGAASSVGSVAVQLANASGFDVVATASAKNIEYVKSLGAKVVLDYNSSSVEDDVVKALQDGEFAGVFEAVAKPETLKVSLKAASRVGGGRLAPVLQVPEELLPANIKKAPEFIFAASLYKESPEVAKAVWGEYLPAALADGSFLAKPDPIVVGTGLEKIQDGFERHKQGVSAAKVVVKL
ncbi:zinc-binding oxidoreductase CipB [Microthyrium microscopicum]|uniref:Zinc-binding oxidoreductase CipB n=1 Tax=Microthyrium microscopicum TaxID=703497 RepID=A0A6A6USQ3_9PEZI|nr:zinc-binding oxidoreductase CipB [Microthyrium microscopicum]